MRDSYPFPLLPGHKSHPKWVGDHFETEAGDLQLLEYSENFSGWSDDLTLLHEVAVGNQHPIDIASRCDAMMQVSKYINTDSKVIMEIGCSSGFFLADLNEAFPQNYIIGVDVVRAPLLQLAKILPGIPLMRFDLLKCPLRERSIDSLVLLNVLEHIEDDVMAIQKAFSILAPGGVVIIEVPAAPFLYDSYDAELHHFRRYSMRDLSSKLIRSGFQIERASHLGFLLFPAFLIAKLAGKCSFLPQRKRGVKERSGGSSKSLFVKFAMALEMRYLSKFSLPFGIRILITARRPSV